MQVTSMRTFDWHFHRHYFTLGDPSIDETIMYFRVMASVQHDPNKRKKELSQILIRYLRVLGF
jgi:hypothetical protein